MSSGKKQTLSVSLPAEMIEWLDASAKTQALSSRSKAVRCCVNCVALGDVQMAGSGNGGDKSSNYRALDIELAPEQVSWIDSITSKTVGSSQSEVIRSVVEACMSADESVVFGVIRCKSKVTSCEGAQEAVDLLSKRNGNGNVEVKEEINLL